MRLKNRLSIFIWNKYRDLICTDFFWNTRHQVNLLIFHFKNLLFRFHTSIEEKIVTAGIYLSIAISGLKSFFYALSIFFVVTTVDHLIFKYFPTGHNAGTEATTYFLNYFNSQILLDKEGYADFMGGLASVAGVFLGLYFTVISAGIGPHIDKLSPNLRQLIVNEKTGSRYVDLLTIFTALTFLLWFNAETIGNYSLFSIIVILLYALFLICAFYPLGKKSFFLADPPSLAVPLFEKINVLLSRLKQTDGIYGDDSFQSYLSYQVSYHIDSVEEVLDLALEKDAKGKVYVSNIIQNVFNQNLFYLSFKQLVPRSSYWFKRVQKYDDWLNQDDAKMRILKNFGSVSTSEPIPDHYWLESKVTRLVIKSIKHYRNRKDADGLIELLSRFRENVIGPLSFGWNIDQAKNIYFEIQKDLKSYILSSSPDFEKQLQLTEQLTAIGVDIVQQCLQRVLQETFIQRIKGHALKLTRGEKLGESDQWETPALKTAFEKLNAKVKLEISIEKKLISPVWYFEQVLAVESAFEVKELLIKLSDLYIDYGPINLKDLNFQMATVRALILQRQVESLRRLKSHLSYYSNYISDLKKMEKITDISVLELPDKFTEIHIDKKLDAYHEQMSDVVIHLFQTKRDIDIPDFFGVIFSQLTDETFRFLVKKDDQRFKILFPKLLWAALLARTRLSSENIYEHDPIQRFRVSLDPIIDIMYLSGYAKLYSEIYPNTKLFDFITLTWSKTLEALKLDMDSTKWLVQSFKLYKSDFTMTRGQSKRFDWEKEFCDFLIGHGFITDHFENELPPNPPKTKYLKAACDHGYEIYPDLADVFLTAYLFQIGAPPNLHSELDTRFLKKITRANAEE